MPIVGGERQQAPPLDEIRYRLSAVPPGQGKRGLAVDRPNRRGKAEGVGTTAATRAATTSAGPRSSLNEPSRDDATSRSLLRNAATTTSA